MTNIDCVSFPGKLAAHVTLVAPLVSSGLQSWDDPFESRRIVGLARVDCCQVFVDAHACEFFSSFSCVSLASSSSSSFRCVLAFSIFLADIRRFSFYTSSSPPHPPSSTLVRFAILSQMFYFRFYNALLSYICLQLTRYIRSRDYCFVFPAFDASLRAVNSVNTHACWSHSHSHSLSRSLSRSPTADTIIITALVSLVVARKKIWPHTKACLSRKIYIRFLKNRS